MRSATFMHDEDSLNFLEQYIEFTGGISKSSMENLEGIRSYALEKSGLSEETILEIVRYLKQDTDQTIWSERQLEDWFADVLFTDENFVIRMVESGLWVNQHHWYRWANEVLPGLLELGISLADDARQECYYQFLRDAILKEEACEKEKFFWEILYDANMHRYEKYILPPAAGRIYKRVCEENKDWLETFFDLLEPEYNLEGTEVTGGRCYEDMSIGIIEIYLSRELFFDIWDHLMEDAIKRLQQAGLVVCGQTRLKFKKPNQKKIAAEIGMLKELELLWEKICQWKEDELNEFE